MSALPETIRDLVGPYEAGKSHCIKCRRILDEPDPDDCEGCDNLLCGNCCRGIVTCPADVITARKALEVAR